MKKISVNNGLTFVSPAEALEKMPFDVIINYMDDDIREQVHRELSPCTEEEFLSRYLELAHDDLIVG